MPDEKEVSLITVFDGEPTTLAVPILAQGIPDVLIYEGRLHVYDDRTEQYFPATVYDFDAKRQIQ